MGESAKTQCDSLAEIQNDKCLKRFFGETFEPNDLGSDDSQSRSLSEQLAIITQGISAVDVLIAREVGEHYEDLLSRASGTEALETIMTDISGRVQSLLRSVERVRSRVVEPLAVLQRQTDTLCRLQAACDMLRRLARLLLLSRRLHAQLHKSPQQQQRQDDSAQLLKAAKTIAEIDDICDGEDDELHGVAVYDSEVRRVDTARASLQARAQQLTTQAADSLNQVQLVTALQVYHNLGQLRRACDEYVAQAHAAVLTAVSAVFSTATVSDSAGVSVDVRGALWTNVERFVSCVVTRTQQVCVLQKVLLKKQDMFGENCGENNIMTVFINRVIESVKDGISRGIADQPRLRNFLEMEYPKLLRHFVEMSAKVAQLMTSTISACARQTNANSPRVECEWRGAIESLETAYLSRSLSRLFDSVHLVFDSDSLPSANDLADVVKTLNTEYVVASFDAQLSEKISANITKTVQLFATKCEHLLSTDSDSTQVTGAVTQAQLHNRAVINLLYQLDQRLQSHLEPRGPPPSWSPSVGAQLRQLASSALQPLIDAILDTVHATMLSMHSEDFSSDETSEQQEVVASAFIGELETFVNHAANQFLTGLLSKQLLEDSKLCVTRRCLELFVRHASLVRRMGAAGRCVTAVNAARLQQLLTPLCSSLAVIGAEYRALRTFSTLLLLSDEDVCSSAAVGRVLPRSVAAHVILGRRHLHEPPLSPHTTAGWSLARYSRWLDQHPDEKQRVHLISASLEAHAQNVRERGATRYADVYPLLTKLLTEDRAQE